MIGDVLKAVDQNVADELKLAKQEAAKALTAYVEAKQRVAEMESLFELRAALGADLTPVKAITTKGAA